MRVGILGAAEVQLEGSAVDVGTRKQRALLAALALHSGRAVPADTLVDLLWGERPPAAVTATLQGYVAGLRRALEPDRAPRAPSTVLVTRQDGYALALPAGALDAHRFQSEVSQAHDGLADPQSMSPAALEEHLARLSGALALWRGMPYVELEEAPAAVAERNRLEELRVVALEDRAVAALALGRHQTVAGELEVLTTTYPLRERLWALRALALARSGRQADALEVLRQVRELLAEELGIEPGAELRDLQTAVLRQDPSLDWRAPVGQRATTTAEQPPAGAAPPRLTGADWPLVGRDDQLAALVGSLEQSTERPVFAVLTGDPGIGKSRLCAELAARARADGTTLLVGRCSQDEGSPPLYPWNSVLQALGEELPSGTEEQDLGSRFRAWEGIVRTLLAAAAERHLLLVLDDLHWADTSTLRVLKLLAETAHSGRLMVVATWRQDPAPTGRLAEVAEMLARRHALRLELTGLSAEEAGEVVAAVAEATPTAIESESLRRRTDGNPFFLVEFARLARERGDLAGLLAEEHPPAAVQDVLGRRIAALPEESGRVLRTACVLGRSFDLPALAAVTGRAEDDVLDALEPALVAGLVREVGVDRFRFAHALVRDTAYTALSQTRRGRIHARAAEVLAAVPGREAEVARHWLSAGPQHARCAWQAAVTAAQAARRVFAYDEAVQLVEAAERALDADPAATAEDRLSVLLALGRAYQLTGNWTDLRPTVHRAIEVADRLGDVDGMVAAATMPVTHALWQTAHHGKVDQLIAGVLRRLLDRLPAGDSPHRCRVMLSLAGEIYYGSTAQEREVLAEEAVAMARRIADPQLLLWALLCAPATIWRMGTAQRRLDLTAEAAALAHELDDGISESSAMTLHTVAATELGLMDRVPVLLDRSRELAEREHHLYAQMVLDSYEVAWTSMRGDFARVDQLLANLSRLHERMSLPQSGDALVGAVAMRMVWAGQEEEMLGMLGQLEHLTDLPTTATTLGFYCRLGRIDEARAFLAARGLDHVGDSWFSPLSWALTAEAAAHLGRSDLGAESYALLAPFEGQVAAAGSGTALGPVDAFLALAACATGERELATRHADAAERLCRQWEIPLTGQWLVELRQQLGF